MAEETLSVHEFIALLNSESADELAEGLKRARAVLVCERGREDGLAAEYLKASPEAAELFRIWEGISKEATSRIAMLMVDVMSALLSCAPASASASVIALGWIVLRTKCKTLVSSLSCVNPRLTRCALKLMATMVRASPSLARETWRRCALTHGAVIEKLATTRQADAMSGTAKPVHARGKGKDTKSAIIQQRMKKAYDVKATDAASASKLLYVHGHADDDIRCCFVRLVNAYLSSGITDVVKDVACTRGLVSAVLLGLPSDPPHVARETLSAFGDAFLLSRAVPHYALETIFNSAGLAALMKLYERQVAAAAAAGGAESPQDACRRLRFAVHAFMVPLTTGKLLLEDIAALDATDEERLVQQARKADEDHDAIEGARKRPHPADMSIASVDALTEHFCFQQAPRAREKNSTAATASELPNRVPCILQSRRKPVVTRTPASSDAAASSAPRDAASRGSLPAADPALQFLLSITGSHDALQRDLVMRVLQAHPHVVPVYLRAFALSMEPRPSFKWACNIDMLARVLLQSAVDPHRTSKATVQMRVATAGALAPAASGQDASAHISDAYQRRALRQTVPAAAPDGPSSHAGAPDALPASTLLLQSIVPKAVSRSALTRGILNPHPAVVLHTLRLLRALLVRAARVLRDFQHSRALASPADLIRSLGDLASSLPDVTVVLAVRAKAQSVLDNAATHGMYDLHFGDAMKDSEVAAPSSLMVPAAVISQLLQACMYAVLRLYIVTLTPIVLPLHFQHTTLGALLEGAGAQLDVIKLVPSTATVFSTWQTMAPAVQETMIRALLAAPTPTHAELLERWLARPSTISAPAADDAGAGFADADARQLALVGAESPMRALVSMYCATSSPRPAALLYALLKRSACALIDPSAPTHAGEGAERDGRPTNRLFGSMQAAIADSRLADGATEVDAWLQSVRQLSTAPAASPADATQALFSALLWAGAYDATISPHVAFGGPSELRAATAADARVAATTALPFTLRAWLALAHSVMQRMEDGGYAEGADAAMSDSLRRLQRLVAPATGDAAPLASHTTRSIAAQNFVLHLAAALPSPSGVQLLVTATAHAVQASSLDDDLRIRVCELLLEIVEPVHDVLHVYAARGSEGRFARSMSASLSSVRAGLMQFARKAPHVPSSAEEGVAGARKPSSSSAKKARKSIAPMPTVDPLADCQHTARRRLSSALTELASMCAPIPRVDGAAPSPAAAGTKRRAAETTEDATVVTGMSTTDKRAQELLHELTAAVLDLSPAQFAECLPAILLVCYAAAATVQPAVAFLSQRLASPPLLHLFRVPAIAAACGVDPAASAPAASSSIAVDLLEADAISACAAKLGATASDVSKCVRKPVAKLIEGMPADLLLAHALAPLDTASPSSALATSSRVQRLVLAAIQRKECFKVAAGDAADEVRVFLLPDEARGNDLVHTASSAITAVTRDISRALSVPTDHAEIRACMQLLHSIARMCDLSAGLSMAAKHSAGVQTAQERGIDVAQLRDLAAPSLRRLAVSCAHVVVRSPAVRNVLAETHGADNAASASVLQDACAVVARACGVVRATQGSNDSDLSSVQAEGEALTGDLLQLVLTAGTSPGRNHRLLLGNLRIVLQELKPVLPPAHRVRVIEVISSLLPGTTGDDTLTPLLDLTQLAVADDFASGALSAAERRASLVVGLQVVHAASQGASPAASTLALSIIRRLESRQLTEADMPPASSSVNLGRSLLHAPSPRVVELGAALLQAALWAGVASPSDIQHAVFGVSEVPAGAGLLIHALDTTATLLLRGARTDSSIKQLQAALQGETAASADVVRAVMRCMLTTQLVQAGSLAHTEAVGSIEWSKPACQLLLAAALQFRPLHEPEFWVRGLRRTALWTLEAAAQGRAESSSPSVLPVNDVAHDFRKLLRAVAETAGEVVATPCTLAAIQSIAAVAAGARDFEDASNVADGAANLLRSILQTWVEVKPLPAPVHAATEETNETSADVQSRTPAQVSWPHASSLQLAHVLLAVLLEPRDGRALWDTLPSKSVRKLVTGLEAFALAVTARPSSEQANLASHPGVLSVVDAVLCALLRSEQARPKTDGTPTLAARLHAALVQHPSFLHLLLRNRYIFPPTFEASTGNGIAHDPLMEPARDAMARILLRLTLTDPGACVSADLLPVVAAAYGASLSNCDRTLRLLLQAYEQHGISPANIGFTWSQAALPYINWRLEAFAPFVRAVAGRATSTDGVAPSMLFSSATPSRTSFDWLFTGERASDSPGLHSRAARPRWQGAGAVRRAPTVQDRLARAGSAAGTILPDGELGLVQSRLWAHVSGIPIHRGPIPEGTMPSASAWRLLPELHFADVDGGVKTHHAIDSDTDAQSAPAAAYDPSYVLPAVLACLSAGKVNPRRFVSSGALTVAVCATTSSHERLRQAAYAIIGAYFELLQLPNVKVSFREHPQVALVLTVMRNTVTTAYQRLPSLHAVFIATCLHVVLRPTHPMYAAVNRYLLRVPSLDPLDVPMLYLAFRSGESGHGSAQAWMARILGQGLQCAADHAACRRRHAYHLILSVATASGTPVSVQVQLMDTLLKAVRIVMPVWVAEGDAEANSSSSDESSSDSDDSSDDSASEVIRREKSATRAAADGPESDAEEADLPAAAKDAVARAAAWTSGVAGADGPTSAAYESWRDLAAPKRSAASTAPASMHLQRGAAQYLWHSCGFGAWLQVQLAASLGGLAEGSDTLAPPARVRAIEVLLAILEETHFTARWRRAMSVSSDAAAAAGEAAVLAGMHAVLIDALQSLAAMCGTKSSAHREAGECITQVLRVLWDVHAARSHHRPAALAQAGSAALRSSAEVLVLVRALQRAAPAPSAIGMRAASEMHAERLRTGLAYAVARLSPATETPAESGTHAADDAGDHEEDDSTASSSDAEGGESDEAADMDLVE